MPLTRGSFAARRVWLATGLLLLLATLAPPVDRMSDELFSAHMTQHLVIGLVAPLLVVVGLPALVARPLPTWSVLLAVGAHAGTFWAWHVPFLYDAAVRHVPLHVCEHATLLVTGVLFWWAVLSTSAHHRSGAAVLYLFVAGLADGALAALLTLSPSAWYDVHTLTTASWGLTPLEDQQLAGAIMWVPGGIVYLCVAVFLFVRWLQPDGVRAPMFAMDA